ncbi:3-keto-disaccharide hydrolase [Thalassotalea litorea]|uniref:3-keto-disaccharide hydrolase n=1 Tax=Thalassotalea litorea TaxID=2020715 RepID=UPI0037361F02
MKICGKFFTISLLLSAVAVSGYAQENQSPKPWKAIFDGHSLNGWTPKFAGYALGTNYKNTFRVEDGYLTTNYDQYDSFNFEFGHLYYQKPYSHYRLRATYRFLPQQLPGYRNAWKNNGFMIHAQPPESMTLEQRFPASIEVQLLGADADTEFRPTANICTPNSHVKIAGALITKHCIKSNSKTYRGEQWVTIEIEVKGHEMIKHWINGELVMEYHEPVLDEESQHLSKFYDGGAMKSGYIAIQAENSRVQFKSIELQEL